MDVVLGLMEGGMVALLSENRVHEIMLDSLFQEDEDTSNRVGVEGITLRVGLHPDRLNAYREEIMGMLLELPTEFLQSGGGGWSFLNACNDRHGLQWTGFHTIMEELVILGIGVGAAKFILPREMWGVLPGGMPYLVVLDE